MANNPNTGPDDEDDDAFPRERTRTQDPLVARVDGQNDTHDSLPAIALTNEAEAEFEKRCTTCLTQPFGGAETRDACLSILAGPGEGRLIKLAPGGTVTIGRDDKCELPLNDDGVSRRHAAITAREDGVFAEDLNSRNGTYVGSKRINGKEELISDDLIRIGGATVIKFSWMAPAEAEHHQRLKAAALRDGLTGLFNRRHFDACLQAEVAAALRHNKPLCLLVLDIDDFKKVNDNHGHVVGDQVLRQCAQELQDMARKEDLTFRYGGEELAVLARDTDLRGGLKLAERARRRISRLRLRTSKGDRLYISVSIGVAQIEKGETPEDLINRADEAMYTAKRKGKDRVVGSAPGFRQS